MVNGFEYCVNYDRQSMRFLLSMKVQYSINSLISDHRCIDPFLVLRIVYYIEFCFNVSASTIASLFRILPSNLIKFSLYGCAAPSNTTFGC